MKKIYIAVFLLLTTALMAASKHPVDVSYFVADLKYNKQDGVKICEVQQGILSRFSGDIYLNDGNGEITPKIVQLFGQFPVKKWSTESNIAFPALVSELKNSLDWVIRDKTIDIFSDKEFQHLSKIPPENPNDIASYHGILFIRSEKIIDYDAFHQAYPGIVVSGAPSFRYWIDKYKMTQLFDSNPLLAAIKPEWRLYPKKYTATLAEQIIEEIPGDCFVIKPRGAFLGQGVIIVSKEALDSTLQYILGKSLALKRDPDKSYSHWYEDQFDSLIVEKYYPSDLIQVKALDNKTYQPTMRVVFSLTYNNEQIGFESLGAYWIVPIKSLEEDGTPNETKKACCRAPFFTKVSDEDLEEVNKTLEITMPLLYQQMLEGA